MALTLRAQDRIANAPRRIRLKNAKTEAAERQRLEEGVPVNDVAVSTTGPGASLTNAATSGAGLPTSGPMPEVNPAGLSPDGDTARPSSGVAARRTADGVCGVVFVRGELHVVFTDSERRKVFVPYVTGNGALVSLGQSCAPAAESASPCGAFV